MNKTFLIDFTFLAVATASLLTQSDANAASITSRMTENDGQAVIELTSEIVTGDADRVKQWIKYWNNRDVRVSGIRLNSYGGQVFEAEQIAFDIREAGMDTVIGKNQKCFSSCVLIFAYGIKKWANHTSQIGVHSVSENGKETLEANALTTAFVRDLKQVGTPDSVIVKTITTRSDDISVLTVYEVQAMGGRIL